MTEQPSPEAIRKMLNFFMATSIPRLLADKERESQRSNNCEIDEEMTE